MVLKSVCCITIYFSIILNLSGLPRVVEENIINIKFGCDIPFEENTLVATMYILN